MIYLAIAIISLFFLLSSNIAYGITASEFVSKFGYSLDSGQKVEALITVSGEPQSTDPLKRAKEIRYLQSGVLKFAIFAGAINVKSDTLDNQFQAEITTSLLEVLKNRKDVLSVEIISQLGNTDTIIETKPCSFEKYPVDLSGCNLYGKILTDLDLREANLSHANLFGTTLSGKDLSGANLSYAFLKKSNLDDTNLTGANLFHANLIDADVRHANLSNANMTNSILWRTDFTNSNLTNADMTNAILTYAILLFVDLDGANLDGAGTHMTNLGHCKNHPICE